MPEVPVVLFACRQNAGRSVAGSVLMRHHAGGRVEVRSAGTAPGDHIHENVAAVLAERGLDVSHEVPKALTDEIAEGADVIVTMGCGESCPVYLGTRYLDWELEDPHGQDLVATRAIIDDIERRVLALLEELASTTTPKGTGG